MDNALIKSIIGSFDKNVFEAFFLKMLDQSNLYKGKTKRLSYIDDRVFECSAERFYQSADVFFMCYTPYKLFERFSVDDLDLSLLKELVSKYISDRNYYSDPWLPIDGVTLYLINNFDSEKLGVSDEVLLEHYEKAINPILSNKISYIIGTGNINTFLNAEEEHINIQNILRDFFIENDEGICICLSDNGIEASRFLVQNEFAGITPKTHSIIQPAMRKLVEAKDILCEFNRLIFSDMKESVIEEFLREHYREIFGSKYDSISTQLWLKFPDLDIGKRERRLDIQVRNAVQGGWEFFELKRSNIELTKSISDVPMFVSAVNDAIAQVKNYKHLLMQDND